MNDEEEVDPAGFDEHPRPRLRIYNGRLQQQFFIVTFGGGEPSSTWNEWRDVPVIDEPEEEV